MGSSPLLGQHRKAGQLHLPGAGDTKLLTQLEESLENRWCNSRLVFPYKIFNGHVVVLPKQTDLFLNQRPVIGNFTTPDWSFLVLSIHILVKDSSHNLLHCGIVTGTPSPHQTLHPHSGAT